MEVILSAEEAIKEGELSSFSEKLNKDMPSSDDMIERYRSQELGVHFLIFQRWRPSSTK